MTDCRFFGPSMYYNSQYAEGSSAVMGDPMAVHRGEDYGYSQAGDYGRGDGSFSGNLYNAYDSYDERGGYGDNLPDTGYSRQDGNFDDIGYGAGPPLQSAQVNAPSNDYYRQPNLPQVEMGYSQPGFDQQAYPYGSEGSEGSYEGRRDNFKDPDRERDRDRCVLIMWQITLFYEFVLGFAF